MTIATYITLIRIFLIPIQVYLIYYNSLAALVLFVLLALSDWLDGFLARKFDMVSTAGKFLDPLADKMLVTALLVVFYGRGVIDIASLIFLISREFAVQGLRMMMLEKNIKAVGASLAAKGKTAVLMLALVFMIAEQLTVAKPLYYLGVFLALISLIEYYYKNRKVFKSNGRF